MIGMNAVVLDGAVIGSESIVGALALVKSKANSNVVAGAWKSGRAKR